ncbi:alpha/beta fold hydrolase [Epilithonimonas lactis]|uniref:Alpha/beta hydrolase n=1 Tax=Epilithonimonas lactis TaxID=421072 RepID=A0A085BHT6_9FLAO|nr:alpha/beta fold hydrolase [Epilithonimonas lactis]KFC22031.1 alpha/beta hydrolase [Epilithonimonas lactis]SEQ52298.1 Pimeloyl-ACP methyl ester carboxylesterase [Epilithonimonas lactis]
MLNYEIEGNGTENLVLLHGFMENISIWEDLKPHLSEKFKLIKIDLPGFGKSEVIAEVQTMELMAEELKKVADHLKLNEFHLLGHSMGGYIALAFAEKYPEDLRSCTLFFSTYFADDEEKKQTRTKGLRIIKENLRAFVNAGVPNLFNPNEHDILESKIKLAKEIAYTSSVDGVLASQKGMIERPDRSKVLENFEGKILILSGKHDSAVNSEKTIKNLPDNTNIKSYVLDCGHNGHWEKPEVCASIINTELLHHLPKKFVL